MNDDEYSLFQSLFKAWPSFLTLRASILRAYELLVACYTGNGVVLTCGNGGSAADAEHIVGELMKGFRSRRPLPHSEYTRFASQRDSKQLCEHLQGTLPAISLVSQSALISAFSNDVDPELVFAQQVYGYGKSVNSVLIALSTSGNSANVVKAVEVANSLNLKSIGITGQNGGCLLNLCTVNLRLPAIEVASVQEQTMPVYHTLCAMLEAHFFPDIIKEAGAET
jgi:D-sedoheptulose 7-phosphate isomerase